MKHLITKNLTLQVNINHPQSLISVEGTSRGKSLFPSKMIEDCEAKYFTQIFPTEKPNGRQFLTEVMWWNKSRETGTPGNLDQTKEEPNCS